MNRTALWPRANNMCKTRSWHDGSSLSLIPVGLNLVILGNFSLIPLLSIAKGGSSTLRTSTAATNRIKSNKMSQCYLCGVIAWFSPLRLRWIAWLKTRCLTMSCGLERVTFVSINVRRKPGDSSVFEEALTTRTNPEQWCFCPILSVYFT